MSAGDVAGKPFWDDRLASSTLSYQEGYKPAAFDLWGAYLPPGPGKSCLEIGCFPGRNLIFLHKKLGYYPMGVDYTVHLSRVPTLFKQEGIEEYRLLQTDFLELPAGIKADLVFSMGFVEHFDNFEAVLRKHVEHTKPGGYIVVEIPNFRYCQYYLHKLFDAEILRKHVLKVMRPKVLAEGLQRAGATVIMSTYWETFDWWCDNSPQSRLAGALCRCLYLLSNQTKWYLKRLDWDRVPNRWFSPFIVCIAKIS